MNGSSIYLKETFRIKCYNTFNFSNIYIIQNLIEKNYFIWYILFKAVSSQNLHISISFFGGDWLISIISKEGETMVIHVFLNQEIETSIQKAEKELAKRNWYLEHDETIFFPHYFSEWEIRYFSFFRKKRMVKKIVAANAVTGEVSFADFLPEKTMDISKNFIVPKSKARFLWKSREWVRRYLHYKKGLGVPEIKIKSAVSIYLPYSILHCSKADKDKCIAEHISGGIEQLKNAPVISREYFELYQRRIAN